LKPSNKEQHGSLYMFFLVNYLIIAISFVSPAISGHFLFNTGLFTLLSIDRVYQGFSIIISALAFVAAYFHIRCLWRKEIFLNKFLCFFLVSLTFFKLLTYLDYPVVYFSLIYQSILASLYPSVLTFWRAMCFKEVHQSDKTTLLERVI
jgi:hypothetical protein